MSDFKTPPRVSGKIEWTAAGWTIGSLIGCVSGLPWWFWLVSLLASSPWLIAASQRRSVMLVSLLVACVLLSAGRAARQTQLASATDIRCLMGSSQAGPIRLRLRVGPQRGDGRRWCHVQAWNQPSCGSDPSTWHAASGRVLLKSGGISLAAGSCIDATGRCTTGLGRDGRSTTFEIFTAAHIQHIDPPRQWQQWLNATRHRVQDVLTAPPLSGGHINSMVSAIVLGRRDGGWNEIAAPFRGTGTAHLLAVSGLHLAVLCGIVLAGTRWCGASIRRGSAVAVVATVMMLCVAEIRTPLARAGMMVLVAAGLSSLRWRVSAGSVLAVAALAIELENPRAVVDIGFQLSFSVVAALIYVFPAWSRRIEITGIPRSALVESIRATTTAWLVATPIAAHHFGMMSLLGIPATLVLFPMVAGVLVLGYFRILLCASVFASDLSGHALNVVTSMLWKSVHLLDWIPGSGIDITAPSWAWVCAAECAGLGIMLGRRNTTRIPSGIGLVVLWLLASSF